MDRDKEEYPNNDGKHIPDTTEKSSQTNMPSKNAATDHTVNASSGELGLNQASTPNNDMEPGTASQGEQ
jgi:hypothetical protein